ncbi:UNKNOWN [Stylonychia lemnae]|uniref:Uncharacterized protein n=1 Tax=Stylonychia lemnae TaxID=5949 RepID=A0A078A2B8_STYLE|nr:UNKNOWN [Stylonychia lemnae]|eukprot:CDW76280.1 UNKNOWN [Stylonychia lemnae]
MDNEINAMNNVLTKESNLDYKVKDSMKSKKEYVMEEKANMDKVFQNTDTPKKLSEVEQYYQIVIPHDRPLNDNLHHQAIGNYRRMKRESDGGVDEYNKAFGSPLSRAEHDFHNVSKNWDYDVEMRGKR